MNKIFMVISFIGVPLVVAGSFMHWTSLVMFILCCVSIIGLSAIMGRATESLAIISGPRIGGLLNATFGNAVELIISIFSLKAGLIGIVLASLTGSVIGNLLLVLGLSFFLGGLKHKRQNFSLRDARYNAGLLIFAIIVAFVIPEIFSQGMDDRGTISLSVGISVIMILLYLAGLFFKLVTHRGFFTGSDKGSHGKPEEEEEPEWSKGKAILILLLATAAVAFVSENLVHTFEDIGERFGWSELFIGVIIVAIVGNAAEHASALILAVKDKMDVSVEIAIGSTLQVAMFVAPALVLVSLMMPVQMPLVFTIAELVAMITAALLTIVITLDGESNWFEGLTLLAAYLIMGIGFFFL
ncbi:calcium/proton exchanger [Bhargavaea beijingensis]|uniref:Ca(2+)/H(+) antiporter n=2 Tax=Bhargavaea beijingensis TaxID=426756 RepID=A0A1G7B9T3_9BACL|nr:calcium/proton exchanger [Bhargavaea beijingensis]MCW1928410.1 calcium/proton exchanger [Bhargavaea beijingensis]SDE23781.1 Ca2+:H+ antiporter [Bhargavaea beijingensis]